MSQLAEVRRTTDTFWGVYELGVVAGVLPLIVIGTYDVAGAMVNDSVYQWQVIVGPPLIAAVCGLRVGPRRAAQIALVGMLTAVIALVALWFVLVGVGFGA